VRRYLFTTDHKMVGLQYFWLSLVAVVVGMALSLLMRFHLVNPDAKIPWFETVWPVGAPGGVMTPELYLSLMTMHGTIMVFFVLSVTPQSAFGNYFLPLQIGARGMAFPILTSVSFWATAASFVVMMAAFIVPGGAPLSGWTAYPPLSAVGGVSGPGEGMGQTLWLCSIAILCIGSTLGAVNFIATTLDLRGPGVTMMRMPLTCWSWFVTAILSLMGFPVLLAAGTLLLLDRSAGTSFFVPSGLLVSDHVIAREGGSPLLWQHLFWFFGHPEVYIAILPGMGLTSEIISTFSRKTIFGRSAMIFATFSIGFLGLLVWGHHMFTSGMSPYSSIAFAVLSMTIGVPSAVKTFNWLGTLWGGRIRVTTAMLFALGFVSVFVTGGLSGMFLAQPVLDLYFHDTYFVLAHFHLIMGVAALFGIFAAVFYWFPRMFGRMLNETLGKIHFFATLVGVYALFLPMHVVGIAGNPRRYADFTNFEFLTPLLPLHQFMTWAAFLTVSAQIVFFANLILTIVRGPAASTNPWCAETLEWTDGAALRSSNSAARPGVSAGFLAVVAAVSMLFAALSSAYVVRHGISSDWTTVPLPPTVWASAVILLLGSVIVELGYMNVAAGLGVLFALAQLWGWQKLIQSGVSMASGPAAAFFYVMSGAFLILVVGGVVALLRHPRAANFWHYLSGLWIYLLFLFYLWN
jgi:cytochrome c oxidase subunit I